MQVPPPSRSAPALCIELESQPSHHYAWLCALHKILFYQFSTPTPPLKFFYKFTRLPRVVLGGVPITEFHHRTENFHPCVHIYKYIKCSVNNFIKKHKDDFKVWICFYSYCDNDIQVHIQILVENTLLKGTLVKYVQIAPLASSEACDQDGNGAI